MLLPKFSVKAALLQRPSMFLRTSKARIHARLKECVFGAGSSQCCYRSFSVKAALLQQSSRSPSVPYRGLRQSPSKEVAAATGTARPIRQQGAQRPEGVVATNGAASPVPARAVFWPAAPLRPARRNSVISQPGAPGPAGERNQQMAALACIVHFRALID